MFWAGRSLEDDLLTTPSIDPIQPNFVSSQIPPKKQALILSSYYRGILGFPCLPLPIIPIFCGTLSWSSLFLQYLDHFQQVKANIPQELCKNGQVWRSEEKGMWSQHWDFREEKITGNTSLPIPKTQISVSFESRLKI